LRNPHSYAPDFIPGGRREVGISNTSGTHEKHQGSGHVRNQLEIVPGISSVLLCDSSVPKQVICAIPGIVHNLITGL